MEERKYKILHIEDDAASRLVVKKMLDKEHFQYFEAATGIEGLQKVSSIRPDLILMDINLPDISGVELTTKIKSDPALRDVVVVALTAIRDPEARALSLIAGCDGYISKPVDFHKFPDQLLQFIHGKKEKLETEKRDYFHQRYEESLVSRLTEKLRQLQQANKRLSETTSILKEYSQKLEMALSIVNTLQQCRSPSELEKRLVDEIVDKLGFGRCIFMQVNYEEALMEISYARGLPREEWPRYILPYDSPFFQNLFQDRQIIYIPNLQKIPDFQVKNILKRLNTRRFLFGILGVPNLQKEQSRSVSGTSQLLETLVPTLHDQKDSDMEIIQEHLREFLSSEIFYLGGFLYIDYVNKNQHITPYDVHILEMLLRNASLIYQNLHLREQMKELFVRAERDAITDYLTDLYNYRYFIHQLSREFNRAQRHKSHFALLMIDIDHFKIYNDSFGHQAGDLVLKKIAKILRENTRNSDVVARYGGEEFVIICPELFKQAGVQLAEKLRNIVSSTHFPQEQKLPHKKVTISIGVSAYPDDAATPRELILRADQALYQAKKFGRNNVRFFSSEQEQKTGNS